MNEFYNSQITNYTNYLNSQVKIHKNKEDIDYQEIEDKKAEIIREKQKADSIKSSLDPLSAKIDLIRKKIQNDLNKSFEDLKGYITKEIEGITIDYTFMIEAKKKFVNEFNQKSVSLIETIEGAIGDSIKFKNLKSETFSELHYESFQKIENKINSYIKFLGEQKENIKEILQKESKIVNLIKNFEDEKFSVLPSYNSIIELKNKAGIISTVEIKKLIDALDKEIDEEDV